MKSNQKWILAPALALSLGAALPIFAQDTPPAPPAPANGGWRRFQNTTPESAPQQNAPDQSQDQNRYAPPQNRPYNPPPASVTIPAGTWITIRVDQPLSSDHSQSGDSFTASLAQPIVANGVIVARRGQMVAGVISEAQKAGRVSGVSRLGLELTEISVADGRQIQVKTKLMERKGETSYGRDAVAIGTTTAAGAAIGAGVNGGVGAGVGAAAGLVASTIGVLLTRGHQTVVYPETPLTFRLESSITVDTSNEAFRPAGAQDYDHRLTVRQPGPASAYPPAYYGGAYGPAYYGGYYGGYPYPYYYGYGPGFYFRGYGPSFVFRGHFRR